MNIVLLSGGSGQRLWPLSNNLRSKQFIKIFKTEDGKYESMVQRVYRQIRKVDPGCNIERTGIGNSESIGRKSQYFHGAMQAGYISGDRFSGVIFDGSGGDFQR